MQNQDFGSKPHFQLGDEAQRAFEQLKELVCQASALVPTKYGKPFHLYTDAACMPLAVVWPK